jgi:RNA polymerase sigma-70 factor (ECF subfamily)
LAGYYLLPATRADFLRRLDRNEEAASVYEQAAALAGTGPERRFLNARLAEVRSRHT